MPLPLATRYGFADAPTSAILGDSSLAWTTAAGALADVGTSLSVVSSAAFPSSVQFDILIGLRDAVTGLWSNAELRHVTNVSGTTWTVAAGSISHASGESISHVVTASGLANNPGARTDAGDFQYLNASGRMARLAAPSDGDYALRWTSGVPSYVAASSGGLSYADLATPPGGTALGSSGTPFGTLVLGTGGNLQYGTPTIAGDTGAYTLTIGPPASARIGLSTGIPLYVLNQDDGTAHTDVYLASFVDPVTKYAWAELDFQLVNSAGPVFRTLFLFGAEGNLADNGTVTNQDFYVYDAIAGHNVLTITPTAAAFFGPVTAPDFILSGGGTLATQVYVNSQGFVTATSATAFTNKTGAISQWSNDASYTTLAAVAGVGYATATSSTAFSNKTGNISQWTNDSSFTTLGAVAGVGYATATSATAFTNKSGNVSQWTNDSSYTTLAAVAGVGYATAASATAFTNKSGNISQWTNDSAYLTAASTATLTNKRITKRVVTASDATSITPNSDSADVTYQANTQAVGTLTINIDGGAPTNGQAWLLKIKSTNVQTFAWNSLFVGGTIALPTTTSGGATIDYFSFIYDTANTKWHFTGSAAGF